MDIDEKIADKMLIERFANELDIKNKYIHLLLVNISTLERVLDNALERLSEVQKQIKDAVRID